MYIAISNKNEHTNTATRNLFESRLRVSVFVGSALTTRRFLALRSSHVPHTGQHLIIRSIQIIKVDIRRCSRRKPTTASHKVTFATAIVINIVVIIVVVVVIIFVTVLIPIQPALSRRPAPLFLRALGLARIVPFVVLLRGARPRAAQQAAPPPLVDCRVFVVRDREIAARVAVAAAETVADLFGKLGLHAALVRLEAVLDNVLAPRLVALVLGYLQLRNDHVCVAERLAVRRGLAGGLGKRLQIRRRVCEDALLVVQLDLRAFALVAVLLGAVLFAGGVSEVGERSESGG